MILNSISFMLFFIVIMLLYFTLLKKWQPQLLLVASLIFICSYKVEYLLWMLLVSVISFVVAIYVEGEKRYKKTVVTLGIICSLVFLFYFKYLNFAIEIISYTIEQFGIIDLASKMTALDIIMLAGISFYTFQNIAYIVDVYRKKIPTERKLSNYILFIVFFPKFTVGPIDRGAIC